MNHIIYIAYGSNAIRCEAILSILSYLALSPAAGNINLIVYTDMPAQFRQVLGEQPDIKYPDVSAATWREWHGAANRVYMLKIMALQHTAAHYPGQLLFVDTDTLWQQLPSPLFAQLAEGRQVLHAPEGTLAAGNALNRKVYQHLKNQTFRAGKTTIRLHADTMMYNSGAIGFRSQDVVFLEETRQLAEQFFAAYDKHIMEQLAFSVRIAQNGPVLDASPYLLHYWNLKVARPRIEALFTESAGQPAAELYARAQRLDLPGLHLAELAYRNLPGWHRTLLKLRGRQWKMPAW